MKRILITLLIVSSWSFASDSNNGVKTPEQIAEEERCTVPAYAKAIGHEELWKKHNGCPTDESKKDE